MEGLVVTLATAQKLKAEGFPQKTYCAWQPNESLAHTANTYDYKDVWEPKRWLAAPSAQEIADQLPKILAWNGERVYLTVEIDPFEQTWVAEYKNENYETRGNGQLSAWDGTNDLAEILALLWLKLNGEAE
jgi:hypothetical protein